MDDNSPLDNLTLSFPCPVSWDSMEGDERERLCKQCSKKVFNISDLTKKEAEELLSVNKGRKMCYTFFVRQDGTIKTDNCPRVLRPIRKSLKSLQRVCSVALAFLFSISSGFAKPDRDNASSKNGQPLNHPEFTRTAGIIALPDFHDQVLAMFLFESEGSNKDAFLESMKKQFLQSHSLNPEQLKELEEYFEKNGFKARAFLAKQAQLQVALDRYGMNSQIESQKEALEKDRQKLTSEMISKVKNILAEKKHDQAVRDLNTIVMLASNPYRAGQLLTGTGLKGVSKWNLTCGGTKKSLLMTGETKKTIIDLLNNTLPSNQSEKDLRKNLLDGLNGALLDKS